MHKPEIRSDVVAAAIRRRGRVNVFDSLDPTRTAHVVVDLQNGFMAEGQASEISHARDIVPNVNKISAALRKAGGTVIYLQHTFDEEGVASWSVFFDHFIPAGAGQAVAKTFEPGSYGHALWPALEILPEDLKVNKRRFGAFVQGSSDLDAILRARGINTLIITGTATNVCCESTARDAMMMNYKVFFASDATATFNDDQHNATLSAMAHVFCDVRDTESLLGLISACTTTQKAAE